MSDDVLEHTSWMMTSHKHVASSKTTETLERHVSKSLRLSIALGATLVPATRTTSSCKRGPCDTARFSFAGLRQFQETQAPWNATLHKPQIDTRQ